LDPENHQQIPVLMELRIPRSQLASMRMDDRQEVETNLLPGSYHRFAGRKGIARKEAGAGASNQKEEGDAPI
jgi:hypothetical protein